MIRRISCFGLIVILSASTFAAELPKPQLADDAAAIKDWQDMRFGQFIHWGLYSLTAGYWEGRRAKSSGHIMLHEQIPVKKWGELAKDFNPVKFNADAWILASKNAGMKYFIITTKHHDGLAMYDSPSSDYDIIDKSPFKRDPMKELADACHRYGIKLGFYYSLGRDWADPDVAAVNPDRSNTWDYPDEGSKVFSRYFERKLKPQVTELLTRYGKVDIMWFDTPENKVSYKECLELRNLIKSLQPGCIINDRIGHGAGDYMTREQEIGEAQVDKPWESCVTMAKHWNYDKDEAGSYKSAELLVHQLIEIVNKGGNYLLNIGPTAEGEYPKEALLRLECIGEWMKINGEGIYGSRPWVVGSELLTKTALDRKYGDPEADKNKKDAQNDATSKVIPSEIRFTSKGNAIYGFISNWDQNHVRIKSLARNKVSIEDVSMLGYAGNLKWEQTDEGLSIEIPAGIPVNGVPIKGFKIKIRQ